MRKILVRDLVKRYRYFELSVPSLEFTQGLNLVIGPNGSGKSTLLRILAGFTYPDKGSVLYQENGTAKPVSKVINSIGYVGEEIVFPNIKVIDILREFVERDKLSETISMLGLERYTEKKYLELSSGYRKRVQLAVALSKRTSMLLLDEPFSNLDVMMIKPLKKILAKTKDKIVVLTSHIALDIEATTLTIINQGRILYHGTSLANKKVFLIKVDREEIEIEIEKLNELLKPYNIQILDKISIEDLILRIME